MTKCGVCGNFLSSEESVTCTKCPATFHRSCVVLPVGSEVAASWVCPSCKKKVKCRDSALTLCKGGAARNQRGPRTCPVDPSPDNSNHDISEDYQQLDLALEIRAFRKDFMAMREEIRTCCREITEFKSCLQFCSERIDLIENRVSALEQSSLGETSTDVDRLESTIARLKNQIDERDQELLNNDITITCLPENKEESVGHVVKLVARKLGVELDERDIVFAERVGPVQRNLVDGCDAGAPSRPRNIAVRLARRAARNALLRAARVRRNLTTTDLQLPGAAVRFYINERLTRNNGQLFYRVRQAVRRLHWQYAWTKDGRIYVRKGEGTVAVRISNESDLDSHFGQSLVCT